MAHVAGEGAGTLLGTANQKVSSPSAGGGQEGAPAQWGWGWQPASP